jgi:HAE1 family hydrophobic/amphiphilic exporter-1
MLSRFFIHRPIFATVVSVVILIVGLIAVPALPVEQTPNITPPTISVSTTYPGASAEVLAETVAFPVEKEVNGVEDMIYMSSVCSSDGRYELTVSFEVGTDIDMATVLVQNRVAVAEPALPEEVKRQGLVVKKKSTSIVLMIALVAGDGRYDALYQSNYINTNIVDVLKRVPGVGEVQIFGARDFGMRIWLDPDRLRARGLTTGDVLAAIREQNVQVAAGRIGAAPSPEGTAFTLNVATAGRLSEVPDFERLIVKVGDDGTFVRLAEVARVELGAQSYDLSVALNGENSIALAVYQLPGANALDVKAGVVREMDRLAADFPQGLDYRIPFDTTSFIDASIDEVIETLLVAILLVVLTVFVFLQDLRTTVIPSVTIPVALIGTFAVMLALGMSINTLSLFGIVLAIGIVVDDAILVVENTMRLIDEEGLPAKQAAEKAMEQITGPVIATTLVLLAVFVPTAMLGGITGRLYQQFAITISVATVLSSVNALTLSPALCGLLLRPSKERKNVLFRGFDRLLGWGRRGYLGIVGVLCRRLAVGFLLFAGVLGATALGFVRLPGGFLPQEDQGYLFANVMLPEGASLERTAAVTTEAMQAARAIPGVRDVLKIDGFSLLDGVNTTNGGCMFITLEPWAERRDPAESVAGIAARLNRDLFMLPSAFAIAFAPPPISGLGNAGGFDLRLQDRQGAGIGLLETVANDIVVGGMRDPTLTRLSSSLRADTPQVFLDIDREKVKKLQIPLQAVFETLQANLGSAYVNDFSLFGRTYRVMAQADAGFRDRIDDVRRLEVRSATGQMVSLATLTTVRETVGPRSVFRYNNYPASTITGTGVPGVSSGEAIAAIAAIAREKMPESIGFEWSGITYQQIVAGGEALWVFAMALAFVFLFLAAQYESWSAPLAVLLNIPIAILGALALSFARGLDNNVYTQIGFVLLIGLAAKNAIMIVEFAREQVAAGRPVQEAVLEAARLRFRAILMTALSFILGVIPLVVASGAGANSRQALGTAVFGGMLLATLVGVLMIPMLYVLVARFVERRRG